MPQIKVGQTVMVKEHTRTRTIFNNAEYTPGEITTYKGGQIGKVTDIYDMSPYTNSAWVDFGDYGNEYGVDELEVIETGLL